MSWEEARAHAAPIRFAVFVEEQGVPAEIELDDMDPVSLHAVAFRGEEAIGTARLLPDGHIGRMAVTKGWRVRGVGAAMLECLVKEARARGHREVVLSAQAHAAGFYRALGFSPEGDEYVEAGIPHLQMKRRL